MKTTGNKILDVFLIIFFSYLLLLIFINWDVLKQILSGEPHFDFIFFNRQIISIIPIPVLLVYKTLKTDKNYESK